MRERMARANVRPGPRRAGGRRPGASASYGQLLTTAEVLTRFDGGPATGVFTDGSCSGNPGPGGWGSVYARDGEVVEQRYGSEPHTTNNRMELTAMIEGLSMLGPNDAVDVYSDSRLVVDTLTKWAPGWERNGWRRRDGEVKNLELVQRAYALALSRPLARIQWIRAHDGSRWNEYADSLATAYLRTEL
jgi:ribonuclease HI